MKPHIDQMTLPQNCSACGKSLEDGVPPTCTRCKTLYCGSTCQRAHWKAGHKKVCKAIAEEGGAAQHHANAKATEAVAALVKEWAAPAKTACRLCKKTTDEAVAVWCEGCSTKDRLAHALCLATYASRIAMGMDDFRGWKRCKGCDVELQGAARVAAARLCWKEYSGKPESDQFRCWAAEGLACALYAGGQYEDACHTFHAHLQVLRRICPDNEAPITSCRQNLANCADVLGRLDELLVLRREIHAGSETTHGPADQRTVDAALAVASALLRFDKPEDAQTFCRETLAKVKSGCPPRDARVVTLTCALAQTLYDPAEDREYMMQDVQEAERLLMEALQASRQVFGSSHPQTIRVRKELDAVRAARRGDAIDGSKLERGPMINAPDDGDAKTIDSLD